MSNGYAIERANMPESMDCVTYLNDVFADDCGPNDTMRSWQAFRASGPSGLAGAATAVVLGAEAEPDVRRWLADFGQIRPAPGMIGKLTFAAVTPAYRRRGLGLALADARLGWLRELGCIGVFVDSWQHPGDGHSTGYLSEVGFRMLGTVPGFYAATEPDWACPYCGAPCSCPAVLGWLPFS